MAPAPKYSPQEQEELILNAAANCIAETSVLDFTMSAISKAAGLSMGSIYKHVQCKEDIIFALATRVFEHWSNLFEQVFELPLTTPEKIVAIGLFDPVKVQVYPFDTDLDGFAANEVVISRASPLWTERMLRKHERCEAIFNKCMHKAAFSGELKLNGNTDQMIEEINLSCWALMEGHKYVQRVTQTRLISEGTDTLREPTPTDSLIVKSVARLLNSYEWQTPLTPEGIEKASALLVELGLR
ncbi:TetR/AcrR family transcriptional regulator [Thalassotalea euphylliae]|uniref:TetR/AcrR family transcriptional regulator n=1 Tax=Thalassotalea euphylliae TaxID=1655234 RepID=A0A3E0UGW2_9GAMM|nr:TetR/AcrR family transcriptional regulator [Thalassotalea euphylliae]REL35837.1 TetR/AcrR family transcriptional regulator [Thalassotalea euphylliae]